MKFYTKIQNNDNYAVFLKGIIIVLKKYITLFIFKRVWRLRNSHNLTIAKNLFSSERVTVGEKTYGPIEVYTWGAKEEKLSIGSFVSIAENVKFYLGGNHRIDTLSTYPFKVRYLNYEREAWTKGEIIIEDDVWIGSNVIILSGVKVGKGAVIAAGSVIAKDVPPYAVVGGNPAKLIKYRFDEKIRNLLQNTNLNDLNKEKIEENIELLYQPITHRNIRKVLRIFKK